MPDFMSGLIPMGDGMWVDPTTGQLVPVGGASQGAATQGGQDTSGGGWGMLGRLMGLGGSPQAPQSAPAPQAPPPQVAAQAAAQAQAAAAPAPTTPPHTATPTTLPGYGPSDTGVGLPPPPQDSPPADPMADLLGILKAGESSNGTRSGKNPKSSASGDYQITDPTWNDFLASGAKKPDGTAWDAADKNDPVAQEQAARWNLQRGADAISAVTGAAPTQDQLLAAHLLGPAGVAKLLQSPDKPAGSMLPGDVFSNNPGVLAPDATGADAIAGIGNWYRGQKGGASGQSSNAATPQSNPANSGPNPYDAAYNLMQSIHDEIGKVPRIGAGDEGMALAAGLLGAPSLGVGMSRALQGMLAMRQAGQKQGADLAHLDAQLAEMGIMVPMRMSQDELNRAKAAAIPTTTQNGTTVASAKMIAAQTGAGKLAATVDGTIPSVAAAARASVGQEAGFDQQVAGVRNMQREIADARGLIQSSKDNIGPAVQQRLARAIANNLGLSIDGSSPDALQALQKQLATLSVQQIAANAGGRIPRAVAEFNSLRNATVNLNTNDKGSALALLNSMDQANRRILAANDTWTNMPPAQRQAALRQNGGMFANWLNRYQTQQAAQDGMTPTASPPAEIQVQPDGKLRNVLPNGVSWSIGH